MRTKPIVLAGLAAAMLTAMSVKAQTPVPPTNAAIPEMPTKTTRTGKHVNRVIDMWLKNQPVYYAQLSGGGYEEGKKMAATKADYITYEMEHGPLDFKELRDFMRGLVDGGPTRTGHKTPAVVVTLPISGTPDAVRANAWMIQQTLATGVHGILLCNAESPEAARLMIEAARYPFAPRVDGLAQGTRGNGSQGFASTIWGVTAQEYMRIADPWPMNPDGEFISASRSRIRARMRTSKPRCAYRGSLSRNGARAITASSSWAAPAPIRVAEKRRRTWQQCGAVFSMPPRRRASSSSTPATRRPSSIN
jgi:hypothetical protein